MPRYENLTDNTVHILRQLVKYDEATARVIVLATQKGLLPKAAREHLDEVATVLGAAMTERALEQVKATRR